MGAGHGLAGVFRNTKKRESSPRDRIALIDRLHELRTAPLGNHRAEKTTLINAMLYGDQFAHVTSNGQPKGSENTTSPKRHPTGPRVVYSGRPDTTDHKERSELMDDIAGAWFHNTERLTANHTDGRDCLGLRALENSAHLLHATHLSEPKILRRGPWVAGGDSRHSSRGNLWHVLHRATTAKKHIEKLWTGAPR